MSQVMVIRVAMSADCKMSMYSGTLAQRRALI